MGFGRPGRGRGNYADGPGGEDVSKSGAARSVDCVRLPRDEDYQGRRNDHFSDGGDVQGTVIGTDVVRRGAAAESLHESGRCGDGRSGGAVEGEVRSGFDSNRG